ncbi:MAG: glutathione S-transferase N-terminal domain-containing protein [Gammaproteobacteria bacterium]|jgi:glutathione S-transferase
MLKTLEQLQIADEDADASGAGADGQPELALYHFETCPFCRIVRQELARLGLEMPLYDIRLDRARRDELVAGGGHGMVPCLRIRRPDGGVEWLYESADIVRYLRHRSG